MRVAVKIELSDADRQRLVISIEQMWPTFARFDNAIVTRQFFLSKPPSICWRGV